MSDIPPTTLYCANHPTRETSLRCNKCNKPICVQCAVLTPIGYRCKECVRGQQRVFETATWIDFPVSVIIAIVLAFIGSVVASFLGFFTLFVAPIVGVIIAEAIRKATHRRRSQRLYWAATAGVIVGSLPHILIPALGLILGGASLGSLLTLVWPVLYVVLLVPSFYYRLSGIQL